MIWTGLTSLPHLHADLNPAGQPSVPCKHQIPNRSSASAIATGESVICGILQLGSKSWKQLQDKRRHSNDGCNDGERPKGFSFCD